MHTRLGIAVLFALVWLTGTALTPARATVAPASDEPETVLATYHPKPNQERELLQVLHEHWATLRRMDLVFETPHLLLRGKDPGGETHFVEVLIWKSAEIPDHAPPEIRAIWDRMQKLVESRGGRPGIEIEAVEIVKSEK
jgi:hypothetical protein